MWPVKRRNKRGAGCWRYLPIERLCSRLDEPPEELCASVARCGLLQPLLVTPQGDRYIVLEGRRRFQAARRAGIARVPAVVIDLAPEAAAELGRWHPEFATSDDVGSERVRELLEEARRRGLVDGEDVIRLRTKGEQEVIEALAEIWYLKNNASGEPTVGARETPPPSAVPVAHAREPAPEPTTRPETGAERQAIERLEQMFASIAVRGRINGAEVERFVHLVLVQRQREPHGFLDWRNSLPLDPVARNAMLVCKACIHMALGLEWTRQQVMRLGVAGLLHNVGLVALGWKPGAVACDGGNAHALEPITHVDVGARLIQEARTWGFQVQSVCLDHHERWNGSGEPRHKSGKDVDLPTCMVALLDTFALLVNPWAGEGLAPREAYRRLEAMALKENLFDQTVFRAFTLHFSKYPVGSVLKLPGGEVARVVGSNPCDPSRPRLRILEPEAQRDRFTDLGAREEAACEDLSLIWEAVSSPRSSTT